MTATTVAPSKYRRWPIFVMPVLVVIAAAAWSAFWFYAASQVDQTVDAWRAREAASGRIYDCAKRTLGGFPFRLEVHCEDATVELKSQTADQAAIAPLTARLGDILVIAQIYTPKLLIAEFKAPATLSQNGQPVMVVNWKTARSSIVGLPGTPQSADIVFDDLAIDRIAAPAQTPVARASHVELHGRIAENSKPDYPTIETVLELTGASLRDVHPVLTKPFDAVVRAMVHGLKDFTPKPWPERFREMQAAGGRVEIMQSRIQQGDLIAIAAGSLGLTANGRLDGELHMTATGFEKVIPALGIEKMLEQGVPQDTLDKVAPGVKTQDIDNLFGALDRAIPGLGKAVRENANVGVAAGLAAIGQEATLEGKKARSFPLRFVDGAVFVGSLKVAQTPPLF
ncbi:conserved hypothetical protein [Nitrobacter hamburgensis X14]|uniref:DUF2125 domain-containing protein n=1 Tax=Nitrobacter hamburgensis (strain DSM 10229 / NCIMB 13809 / X14) TaxID=323097 RepID=Q1QQD7_NITHX|nr:DUF2125 domain-containing protein [Nitrobacter hamburgensis]ABE61560.1 conserved hypothetical protein [Nitrobacter hamburgensis X14]